MGIYQHAEEFAGHPVVLWDGPGEPLDPQNIYRIALEDDGESWTDRFGELLEQPGVELLPGIVVGMWHEPYEGNNAAAGAVEALVAARDRLPALRAIFFGDIISEECEISWIQNTDVSPLFDAYPELEHFCVRGSEGLSLGTLRHPKLRSLVVQSGGLRAAVAREVAGAELPALEHLELWLGTSDYGGSTTVEDIQPILSGQRFPKLRYLGLRNSEIADPIAAALVKAPVLEHISVLDLSLGTLGDEGARALLESPAVRKLQKLDIHHHYCSEEMLSQLSTLGIELDASEAEEPDEEWRYVAVGE